jgi:CrcB protein
MKYLMISLGGILGANARFLLGGWVQQRTADWSAFPWGTFLINVSGSFLLGLFMALFRHSTWNDNWRLLLAIGFLGAYTTFSTFEFESLQLWMDGSIGLALWNLVGSVAIGLAAVWLGVVAARLLHA